MLLCLYLLLRRRVQGLLGWGLLVEGLLALVLAPLREGLRAVQQRPLRQALPVQLLQARRRRQRRLRLPPLQDWVPCEWEDWVAVERRLGVDCTGMDGVSLLQLLVEC